VRRTKLTAEQIERRVPVWVAMSDLFLDTEITDATLGHIARTIDRAGFSADEAKAILGTEVAPVFCRNLLGPAGEWAGWSEASVRVAILDFLSGSASRQSIAGFTVMPFGRALTADWGRIAARLREHKAEMG
jgi:hypothetical protein